MEFMNSFHNTIKFAFDWSSEQVNFLDVNVVLRNGISLPIYIANLRISTSIYFIPRATRILVRRVSLLGRPLGYAGFVPQMLSLRNGLGSCVTIWFKGVTARTTWKGKSIGLVGSLGRTP